MIHFFIAHPITCNEQAKVDPVLKDVDFTTMGEKITIGDEAKQTFMKKLESDVQVKNLHVHKCTTVLYILLVYNTHKILYMYMCMSSLVCGTVNVSTHYVLYLYSIQLLQKLNLMDYSLLVGIHDCTIALDPEEEDWEEEGNGYISSDDIGDGPQSPTTPGKYMWYPLYFLCVHVLAVPD